ncbi:MAG: sugar ABC transporter substrate-binding protein [Planctomycetes bacterium]|nr:sugar ABC transporter substrate-binding protein [Planctomycetota bacterium]
MYLKKLVAVAISAVLLAAVSAGAVDISDRIGKTGKMPGRAPFDSQTYKVVFSVSIADHPVWSEDYRQMALYCESLGNAQAILMGANNDTNTQITQLESLIQSKVDASIVAAVDMNSLDEVLTRARDAGIAVMSFGYEMECVDTMYLVPNYDVGKEIGYAAGAWINERLGGSTEVGVINQPLSKDLIDRVRGIVDALKETAPNAKIVATAKALSVVEGQNVAENFLQRSPGMKVICSIGDGGGIGANEAAKAAGRITDDFGIFCADATNEGIQKIYANEGIRADISLGTSEERAKAMIDVVMNIMNGEEFPLVLYTPKRPINKDNVVQYAKDAGFILQ